MNRFQDKNIILQYFDSEIFVECPKCSQRAVVTKEESGSKILKCPNCFHSEIGRKESFTIELNCHCSNCAAEIKVDIPSVNEKKDVIAIKCSSCGKTENYKPRNISQQWKYKNTGEPSDTYFGLPLWLSENFRGNNFWAFNYDHLEYLKQYISAELREKNGRPFMTMVEKLPEWMKSGKNREKLVKLITELEKK